MIKTKQIVSEPHLLAGQASAPTTGSSVGAFFALDIGGGSVEAAFADESGNIIQITNAGALNITGLSHSTLSNLSADDHTQYLNNTRGDTRYYTKTSFVAISAGVSDAGKPVKLNASGVIDSSMVTGGGGSTVYEYTFTLPAAATMALRIASASGVPSGWTLQSADVAAVGEMGSADTTLVMKHNASKLAVNTHVFEFSSGTTIVDGYKEVLPNASTFGPGDFKTATNKNSCGIIDLQSKTDSGADLVIYVKLL